jgi:menaquinone-dependent protoporphyrinogen oxidase
MGDGMGKVLVVYGTKSGCTSGVAERIGSALADAGMSVEVLPAEARPDPVGYDGVVVGSGVRVGQWHSAVKEWVTVNADSLKARPTAFFTVCLTIASDPEKTDEVRAYIDPLLAESGIEPVDIGLFGGWFEPKQFNLLERTVLKAMKAPQGDHRDWDAIDAWTAGVAAKLKV